MNPFTVALLVALGAFVLTFIVTTVKTVIDEKKKKRGVCENGNQCSDGND